MSYTDENDHGLHTQHHKPQTRLKIDRMTRVHTRTNTHMHARTNTHTLRDEMLKVQIHGKGTVIPAAVCFRWTETVKTACRQSLHVLPSGQNPMGSPKTWLPWNCTHTLPVSQCTHSMLRHFHFMCAFCVCVFYQPFGYKLFMNISQKNSEGIIKERILCFSFMCVCVCVCVYIQYDVHKDYDNLSSLLKLQNKL